MKSLKDYINESKTRNFGWSKNPDVDLIMACMNMCIDKNEFKFDFEDDVWDEMEDCNDDVMSAVEDFIKKYKSNFKIYGIFSNYTPSDNRVEQLEKYDDPILKDAEAQCKKEIVKSNDYGYCGQNDDGSMIYNDGAGDYPVVIIADK